MRIGRKRACWGTVIIAAVSLLCARQLHANTPGRSWTPGARLDEPGYQYLAGPRLDTQSGQGLTLWAPGVAISGDDDGFGYRWNDSTWVRTWRLGLPPVFLWPVLSPPGTQYLIWEGAGATNKRRLWLTRVDSNSVAPPETVGVISPFQVEYSAAVTPMTRWAAFYDQGPSMLRIFTSTQPGIWTQTIPGNYGFIGVSVAPLDDSTAAVAWTNEGTLNNGVCEIRSGIWHDDGVRFGGPAETTNRPRFRARPSGGYWLAWGTKTPNVFISTYANHSLSVPETLRCDYKSASPSSFVSESPDLSRDDGEYPAVAWGSDIGSFHEYLSVLVPTDAGFTVADELQDMPGGNPSVARDDNGDVWVAAWFYDVGLHWAHTYTSAIVASIELQGGPGGPQVHWQLSEPAPETWWAVLRALDAGPFQSVARVRAGSSTSMSWSDPSPPIGFVRYKIRRECLDSRYRWESPAVPDPPTEALISFVRSTISSDEVRIEWRSSGPINSTAYRSEDRKLWKPLGALVADAQGRILLTDEDVEPSHHYWYRLGVDMQTGESYVGETMVDVPAIAFALGKVFPNPTATGFSVRFALASSAPASLEIFDLAGRRVISRNVGSMGPGKHTILFDAESKRRPVGVYEVRLRQGAKEATGRLAVIH